jgi:tetratricopeptide (TPR) repeat protein
MSAPALHFFDESALLERLSHGLSKSGKEVVFLVGSGLTIPTNSGLPGVPNTEGIIDIIRSEFRQDPKQLAALEGELAHAGGSRYQSAFQFLQGRRGQNTANQVVRRAVITARIHGTAFTEIDSDELSEIEERCLLMEQDAPGWFLNPGNEALGKLIAKYPNRFGKVLLTTNFDPLIEVSIQRAGGQYSKTSLHVDGSITQTESTGCNIVHLHGYWRGSDTLHTARQLLQDRPLLKASLTWLLRNKIVVALGYSGWDDAFTGALMDVSRDETAYPDIIWTSYSAAPKFSGEFLSRITPGLDRGRVNFYSAIDCHSLLPKLLSIWEQMEPQPERPIARQSNPVRVSDVIRQELERHQNDQTVVAGDEQDRPPLVELCIGREQDLETIKNSSSKVVFLTGIGGQGKSTLAAQYYNNSQTAKRFSIYVWRDCKEERERFENQLAAIVEQLSRGRISAVNLAKQSTAAITALLVGLIKNVEALFVFDNVDHYVDLENGKLTGSPEIFINELIQSESNSQAVFTCRPAVNYSSSSVLGLRLEGLTLDAAVELFSKRGAPSEESEIQLAHSLTEGHAFWLDLLAIQVARRASTIDLISLVKEIQSGRGLLPENTLNSIWSTLGDREQTVLRAIAETVRPETENEISEYLRHKITYSKTLKALNKVRALNLVVVKPRSDAPDLLELHPLVRQFVRRKFTPSERVSFIDAIIKVYKRFIGNNKSQITERPSFSLLQHWTQNAELDIAARNFRDAFLTLQEVSDAFWGTAYAREFCRVARLLLAESNWTTDYLKFKGFENVFNIHVENLGYLGEYVEAEALLDRYERTLQSKDAKYINYCEMRCHLAWVRGDFSTAIQWGHKGKKLKDDTQVDTHFDISHTLALAERDGGQPEVALTEFLKDQNLSEVTNPDELDEQRGGPHYGNIGRCLHFMGQIDNALICYQKSALLLEQKSSNDSVVNQGYIRAWIGELLVARQQFRLAEIFFRAAYLKWEDVSPPKARKAMQLARQTRTRISNSLSVEDVNVESICRDWITGRSVDAVYR